MLLVYQGAELGVLLPRRSHLPPGGEFGDRGDEVVCDDVLDRDDRQSHATLTGTAEGGVDDALGGGFDRRIAQHQGVVLRLGQRLDPLTVGCGRGVDVAAHLL